ncbi:MAG TPA: hypothetical protein DEQ34_13840 [Balneolaceae bacterium]|nr:hypothetical protein [Balneolaceae bacterium]|tara:strand:+ start:13650 stop:14690 length:1041 start_codon:yes stop_codon:yes gene_type:complete
MTRKPVILCVDDEEMILNSLNKQLLRRFGDQFDFEFCESAEEGLEVMEQLRFDGHTIVMVISDQIMPGMAGDKFLIKVHELCPRSIKILLTGQAAIESAISAINKADLYRYITKPWDENDFLMTVERGIQQYFLQNEKIVLLAEVHHRVKNNLAIISGLLQLQSAAVEDKDAKVYLEQSVNRILSIAKIHELIYESEDLSFVNVKEYLERLIPAIVRTFSSDEKQVDLKLDLEDVRLGVNQLVPIGLLFNELITNSMKHAFKDKEDGKITISLRSENSHVKFSYHDNGSGFAEGHTFENTRNLGITLINLQLKQLEAEYTTDVDGKFSLEFSFLNSLTKSRTFRVK